MQKEFDLDVELVHFPLHPETPDEGLSLATLFGTSEEQVSAAQRRMADLAAAEGLPWSERRMTYNSRRAQELGAWAAEQGRGDAFHNAVYRAYFEDGRNIAHPRVLCDAAQRAGLDRKAAEEVVSTRRYGAAVDADWLRSLQHGVRAVPTFTCSNRAIEGAVPYDVLRRFVLDAGAQSREGS